jgi:acetyl esterase
MFHRLRIEALRAVLSLPDAAGRAFGVGPHEVDGVPVEPAMRLLFRALSLDGRPSESHPIPEQREALRALCRVGEGPRPDVPTREVDVGCTMRLYEPPGATGALLWLHGGGYTIGDLETHDALCRRLAVTTGCVVAALDYRLAPEHPFPAAIEDVERAWAWLVDHQDDLGVSRIAVGGDSAGGNLSAVLCQSLPRDAQPHAQLLLYPRVDATKTWPSMERFAKGRFLTTSQIRAFEDNYLNGHDPADVRVSPNLAEDLSGLAPAWILTAALDPLRDGGRAYASRLREAGVEVHHDELGGMIHGFIHFPGLLAPAEAAMQTLLEMARDAMADRP